MVTAAEEAEAAWPHGASPPLDALRAQTLTSAYATALQAAVGAGMGGLPAAMAAPDGKGKGDQVIADMALKHLQLLSMWVRAEQSAAPRGSAVEPLRQAVAALVEAWTQFHHLCSPSPPDAKLEITTDTLAVAETVLETGFEGGCRLLFVVVHE